MSGHGEYMMSEKAKGKRRAYPINTDVESQEGQPLISPPAPPPKMVIAVRFADGTPDLRLEMSQTQTGADVLEAIRRQRIDLTDKRLRLIHAGRQVLKHTSLSMLRPVDAQEEKQEPESRLSLSSWSPREKTRKSRNSLEALEKNVVWLHCAIGETSDPGVGQDSAQVTADAPQAYDRFTDAGLSQEEVRGIRSLFRRVMFGTNANAAVPTPSEYAPTAEQANLLEARWLDSITQPSAYEEPSMEQSSTAPTTPLARILSYILPASTHASPVRSGTQGLLFAFLFPFVAGLVIENTWKPAAFFDGSIWPELSEDTLAMALATTGGPPTTQAGDTTVNNGQGEATTGAEHAPATTVDDVAVSDPQVAQTRPSESQADRLRAMAPDVIVDPVPNNVFSEAMQIAIRAGLLMNFIAGFYLWLYAS